MQEAMLSCTVQNIITIIWETQLQNNEYLEKDSIGRYDLPNAEKNQEYNKVSFPKLGTNRNINYNRFLSFNLYSIQVRYVM